MKMTMAFPTLGMNGTVSNSTVVFVQQKGETFARAKVRPANPRSVDQTKIRSYMSLATKSWGGLTPAQQRAWLEYAKKHFSENDEGIKVVASGASAFTRANVIRQILGLSLIGDAPTEAPPAAPSEIRQLAAQQPDGVGLEVYHGYTTTTGLQVLVRATAAMPSLGRVPRPEQCLYVRGVGPASAQALPASGGSVNFGPTKFVVDGGQRYGVDVRIVRTADGMVSRPAFGDFIKDV